ncbi:MAG: hypothetical protein LAN37_08510 [Acidobacteriia bacterium]|nr:hypothetical protein [Terriglobia bacterium]
MVLLVMSSGRSKECAEAIRQLTGEVVQTVRDLHAASDELRRAEFTAVVVEQHLWELDSRLADSLVATCGTAALLIANLAIAGANRVAREVSAALRRREGELRRAREDAESRLYTELNEALTGILLSSELVLASPSLPAGAATKIRAVYELAMSIRECLGAKR